MPDSRNRCGTSLYENSIKICTLVKRSPRWFSSSSDNRDFSSQKTKTKNAQQVENDKFDFTVDEGKEQLNPSREKNYGKHRRRKVDEKSFVTFLLRDPDWYVHKPDVQNK